MSSEPVRELADDTKDVIKAYYNAVNNPELESTLNPTEVAAVAEVRAAKTQEEWLAAVVGLNNAIKTRIAPDQMFKEPSTSTATVNVDQSTSKKASS